MKLNIFQNQVKENQGLPTGMARQMYPFSFDLGMIRGRIESNDVSPVERNE
jgi:hypothetical protein